MSKLIYRLLNPLNLLNEIKWILYSRKIDNIKLLVFDIDGVLTNGKLSINGNGDIIREFNVRDGLGIKLLQQKNIKIAFISGAIGQCTFKRAEMLDVEYCMINVENKQIVLKELQNKLNISPSNTAFVGDDVNDLAVRNHVSLLIGPRDASREFAKKADLLLTNRGGMGVAREISDRILLS